MDHEEDTIMDDDEEEEEPHIAGTMGSLTDSRVRFCSNVYKLLIVIVVMMNISD